jgi:hypothetical protein
VRERENERVREREKKRKSERKREQKSERQWYGYQVCSTCEKVELQIFSMIFKIKMSEFS